MPATKVWNGNQQLRRLLVPIDSLAPHPKNPRRHNLAVIRESLQRFGQQRPVLVVAPGRIDPERATLVAGHGTASAALEEGWTHIAAVQSDLTDDEIAAYLLADNRTGDLGGYDDRALLALLRSTDETVGLAATGYTRDDLDLLRRLLEANAAEQYGRLGADASDFVQMSFLVPRDRVAAVEEVLARYTSDDGTNARGRALAALCEASR